MTRESEVQTALLHPPGAALVVRVCGGGVGGKGAHVSLHVRVARAMECGVLTSLWCRCRSREEVRKCESVDLL